MAPQDALAVRGGEIEAARAALRSLAPAELLSLESLRLEADGALVIEGEAASLAIKKRALRAAARASGALGVVDRLRLMVAAVGDGEIRAALTERLALDPRFADIAIFEDRDSGPLSEKILAVAGARPGAAGRIVLEVRDGVVVLDGETPGLVRKRLAGVIAWRQPGVRDVVNGLAVNPPEEDGPDELEEAVREALDGHPLFDDAQVKVGVRLGVVRLTGRVASADARTAAETEAWRVLGVDDVINEIEAAS